MYLSARNGTKSEGVMEVVDVGGEDLGLYPLTPLNTALLRSGTGQKSNERSGERGSKNQVERERSGSGRSSERERSGKRDSHKWS